MRDVEINVGKGVGQVEEEGFVFLTLIFDPAKAFLGEAVVNVGFPFGGIVRIVFFLFIAPDEVWIEAVGARLIDRLSKIEKDIDS